jgi:hypothetical protein
MKADIWNEIRFPIIRWRFLSKGKDAEKKNRYRRDFVKSFSAWQEKYNFTGVEYAQRKRTGRREKFLDAMDTIIPRAAFEETIMPIYKPNDNNKSVVGFISI